MIYFAQAGEHGPIKIGYSQNVDGRVAQLRHINHSELTVIGSIEGTREDERALHIQFREFRTHGEWFRPAPALKEYLRATFGWMSESEPEPVVTVVKKKRPPQPREGKRSDPNSEFLTVQDISDELGIGRQAIRAYIKRGDLPGQMIGNRIRISRSEWILFRNGYWKKPVA